MNPEIPRQKLKPPELVEISSPQGSLAIDSLVQERFRIICLLGEGGMSTVYKAHDVLLDRVVALKFISSFAHMDENHMQRFQREARATAKLEHPGIVHIFDFCTRQEPYCIAMEFVEGKTLSDYIADSPDTEIVYVLKSFISVAEALGYAHSQGILHRDIKPSNIMLMPNSDKNVKIMDFGIAKGFDDQTQAAKNSQLTRTGEIIGSPLYMSPEQITNKSLDKRSDIYSVGCALYEALTKSPPYVAESAIETMMKHLNEEPQSLHDASLGKDFPPGLEAVVRKFLEKDPAKRYQTCEEAGAALNTVLPQCLSETRSARTGIRKASKTGLTAASSPDNMQFRIGTSKATKPALTAALVLITALVMTISFALWFLNSIATSEPPAQVPRTNLDSVDTDTTKIMHPYFQPKPNTKPSNEPSKPSVATGADDERAAQEIRKAPTNRLVHLNDLNLSERIIPLLKARGFHQLYLENTILSPAAFRGLKELPDLEDLKLNGSNITPEWSSIFKDMPKLKVLELGDTKIDDSTLRDLDHTKLDRLVLSEDARITDEGLRALSNSAMKTSLRDLNLKGTSITDMGLQTLKSCSNLKDLNVSHTGVSRLYLRDRMKLSHLTELIAELDPPLTDADVKAIAARMPRCKIKTEGRAISAD